MKTYKESLILQEWYSANKRDLPWRQTNDPYLIWISEIILQQTRVAQGLDYYNRFVARFPTIRHVAEAEQMEVLKCWQGLGYYSRARNLHEAAQYIFRHLNGVFPNCYDDVIMLKGIGDYTAAAIVSLAWNQPYPVVDGNVYRVLGRLFAMDTPIDTGKGKKEYRELAFTLMPPDRAGLHNQAIMEFGALQCVPQKPDCKSCPLSDNCLGYASGNVHQYPVKQNKTKVRDRFLNYFFILNGTDTYIRRRSEKDIWEGLYELPLIETKTPMDLADLIMDATSCRLIDSTEQPVITVKAGNVKHILSHQVLHANCYQVEIQRETDALKKYLKIPVSSLDDYPFPKLILSLLNDVQSLLSNQ